MANKMSPEQQQAYLRSISANAAQQVNSTIRYYTDLFDKINNPLKDKQWWEVGAIVLGTGLYEFGKGWYEAYTGFGSAIAQILVNFGENIINTPEGALSPLDSSNKFTLLPGVFSYKSTFGNSVPTNEEDI